MENIFYVDEVAELVNQYTNKQITIGKLTELLNGKIKMKTLKKIEVVPVYVDEIPDTIKQEILYICKQYKTVVHLCLCGCGNESVTPINNSGWVLSENDGKVSLWPSILNKNCPNKYHYILTNNVANVV